MLPLMLQMMLFLDDKLPVVRDCRLGLLRAAALFCSCSTATFEAAVVVSLCTETLLKAALALTHTVAFSLSTMLRLNAFLRLTLACVLPSQEKLNPHGHLSSSTWPSSQTFSILSLLCCGGRMSMNWFMSVQSVLPALCQGLLTVCPTVSALIHLASTALSPLCRHIRTAVTSIVILCGCVRLLISALKTLTVYSAKVLCIVWDLSLLLNSSCTSTLCI